MTFYEVSNGFVPGFVIAGTTSPAGLKSADVEPIRPGGTCEPRRPQGMIAVSHRPARDTALPGACAADPARGRLPEPARPLRGLVNTSGRLMLGLPRLRAVAPVDVVEFTAACPACGEDIGWIEEREETRLRIIVECPCPR